MANFFKVKPQTNTKPAANQKLTVTIERLDINGCGVAYYKKKPIFINGTLPNENVEVSIVEQKNKYSLAKLLKINKSAESRVEARCQHFSLCGGCDIQHLEYPQQLNFKQNKIIELFSRSGIADNIIKNLPWQSALVSSPWHYRRKARIGVQFNKKSQATVGFRQKSTNQLIAVKSCPVLVESATNIFPLLTTLISQLSVKKAIGHIEVISTDSASESQVNLTLIIRQIRAINSHDRNLWQEYAKKNHWHVYFQESDEKNRESTESARLEPANNLHYSLLNGVKIHFSYNDFIQVNQQVNLAMVKQALQWLMPHENDHILDLFCGLGNFSLPLAQQARYVVGVEGVQSMVDKAHTNAKLNHINNCQFFQADLNTHWLSNTWAKKTYNKALLDPARAGAEFAIEQVAELNIPTILYVSCDPTTLARDSQVLLLKGYNIEKIGVIDMFSQTKHVETMVLFSK